MPFLEVPGLCCEGFWRDFRCHPIGCLSGRSISMVDMGNRRSRPKPIKILIFSKINVFLRFERAKPLQTFPTWPAVRVRRSGRVLRHYYRSDMRKTSKIKQKSVQKRIQNQANLTRNRSLESHSWGRPQPLQGWF